MDRGVSIKHETAHAEAKKILGRNPTQVWLPYFIRMVDNRPAFISQVSQEIATALEADWKLHCAYRPQSSGQVERMNITLKETVTKLTIETGSDWVALLPFALFRVLNSPYQMGLTPFEIKFGFPPPITPSLQSELLAELGDQDLFHAAQWLQTVHKQVWLQLEAIYETAAPPKPHSYQPGYWVLIHRHQHRTL